MAAVWGAAQTTAFFENGPQMNLSAVQRGRLAAEGLAQIADFVDFKAEQIDDAIKNLRVSIPGVPAVAAVGGAGAVPAIPPVLPCLISAQCQRRLNVASVAWHYYQSIGRQQTPANMNYTNVLRAFYAEWETIDKLKEEDKPEVPVLSKHFTPIRWLESFRDCALRTFGVRNCPVSYVIREEVAVPAEVDDPLAPGFAFSNTSGSVLNKMIRRLDHIDPLYRTDNSTVYAMLETATRSTIYASTIKPFSRTKDGRAAWLALVSSHAGQDKWERMQKEKLRFLMNTKWNGRSYGLEKFTGQHCSYYIALQECQLHVNFQLPTEHTRVGYLLDNITSNDPDLRAALSNIRLNQNNMRDDFEAAVTHMLPVCPYSKHRNSSRGNDRTATISDVTLAGKSSSKTGVDFRWHTKPEYAKLTKDQKRELYEWQQTKDGQEMMKKQKEAKKKAQLNSGKGTTRKELQAKVKSLEAELELRESTEALISAFTGNAAQSDNPTPPSNPPPNPAPAPAPTPSAPAAASVNSEAAALALRSILKRKRGND